VLALLVFGVAGRAAAGPLDPLGFPLSAQSFPTAAGTYTFNTRNLTLTGPGNTSIQGTLSASGVAVFDFNSITVGSGQVFVASDNTDYTLPPPFSTPAPAPALALLSRGDITINGTINASASGSNPGAGGYPSSIYASGGPGEGQGGGTDVNGNGSAPGGGGFGGRGGNGAAFIQTPPGQLFPSGGGAGGSPYGNLAVSLRGGSAGGTFGSQYGQTLGGSGGGAIELGAIGGITIGGSILANGIGGGSGGGIFLHGDSVALLSSGALSVEGGSGLGGGGGGGRVLILVGEGGFSGDVGSINVSGGAAGPGAGLGPLGDAGAPGVITITAVPEPASLVLFGLGLLGVLGGARYASHRAAA